MFSNKGVCFLLTRSVTPPKMQPRLCIENLDERAKQGKLQCWEGIFRPIPAHGTIYFSVDKISRQLYVAKHSRESRLSTVASDECYRVPISDDVPFAVGNRKFASRLEVQLFADHKGEVCQAMLWHPDHTNVRENDKDPDSHKTLQLCSHKLIGNDMFPDNR